MKLGKSVINLALTSLLFLGFAAQSAVAANKGVEENQKNLEAWAKKPEVISAIEKANAGEAEFNNSKWKALSNNDPKVQSFINSEAGKLLTSLQTGSLGKLFIRDAKGNFVAGSKKPAIFNITDRPAFSNAMRGKTWSSKKAKADPTTQQKSIQISSPVVSKGKVIGVIHASVVVK